jgi:microcystin-dependent protein
MEKASVVTCRNVATNSFIFLNIKKKKMKRNSLLLFLLVALSTSLTAQNSSRISIQGTLRDGAGAAVPNGLQPITFKLFSTTSGGTAIWEEQADVNVTGGIYTHLLGSINPLSPSLFSQTVYVGIIINGKELLPRTELTYSPYTLFTQAAGNGVPAGSVISFIGSTIPSGWLLCNGQALSSADYPELFSVLGTVFGDGSAGINGGAGKDFNLPDYRGEFLRGLDEGRGVDANRTLAQAQPAGTKLPSTPFTGTANSAGAHSHTLQGSFGSLSMNHTTTTNVAFGSNDYGALSPGIIESSGAHTHTVTLNGGGDSETRPRNRAVRYIVKY